MTTPETAIGQAVEAVGLPCGHWPLTTDHPAYIGWKPAGETEAAAASGSGRRLIVSFDLVFGYARGWAGDAEKTRMLLRQKLTEAGFTVTDSGPEMYLDNLRFFYWPMTAKKGFVWDVQTGLCFDPKDERGGRA